MSAQRTRLTKEARELFGPWCAVAFVPVLLWLPLPIGVSYFLSVHLIGFWIGIPLLATLSLGKEFQFGTFPLLLSQPAGRVKLWGEKWIVLIGALLTCAPLYFLGRVGIFRQGIEASTFAALWIIMSACSATFWTLVARSAIGGLVLNLLQGTAILIAWQIATWRLGPDVPADERRIALVIAAFGTPGYALVMLWLGRRKLARFQFTEASTGNDLPSAIPNFTRRILQRLLRCRSTGTVLNLIRKEVWFLWPVWLLLFACLVTVVSLGTVQYLRDFPNDRLALIAAVVIATLNSVAMVLAGSLSMGEERTLGTHSFHMTLPVSARLQWAVKLSVAIFASFIGLALPVAAAQLFFGQTFVKQMGEAFATHGLLWLFAISSILGLAAFWCGCAVKGTVRAVLWFFPAVAAVLLALNIGLGLSEKLQASAILDHMLLSLHPFPFKDQTESLFFTAGGRFGYMWLLIAPILVALIQSYWLFRQEAQENVRLIRHLMLVVIVTILVSFASRAPLAFALEAERHMYETINETHEAVGRMGLDISSLSAHPQQFTIADLTKAYPVSSAAREMLRGATITARHKSGNLAWFKLHRNYSEYFTTIHFRNGWDCTAYGGRWFHCATPPGWQKNPTWGGDAEK